VAEYTALKYRAFLSCTQNDQPWGRWLQNTLEKHRIDSDLVGRWTPAGRIPRTLRPIFRDSTDLSIGRPLTEQTLSALQAARFLIVLCSPEAAISPRINEEIRCFNAMGRADRVIPVIIDGDPGHRERECLPSMLRFKLGLDRRPTNERGEPIAIDARPSGDGRDIAAQKVLAALNPKS